MSSYSTEKLSCSPPFLFRGSRKPVHSTRPKKNWPTPKSLLHGPEPPLTSPGQCLRKPRQLARHIELSTHQRFPLSSGNISQGSEAAEGRSQSSLHTWTLTQLALSPGTCQPLSTPAAHPEAQLSAGRSSPLCCALVTPRWGFPRQGGWKGFRSGNVISSPNRRSQEASAPPHPGPAETLK